MENRLNFIIDAELAAVRELAESRIAEMACEIDSATVPTFLEGPVAAMLQFGFGAAGADEGTLWIVDSNEEYLVAAYNNGPNAEAFVGKFRQPLGEGIVSMVYASANPYCENEVYHSQEQDGTLDGNLGVLTCAMIAVPVYYGGALRGVLSAVKLRERDSGEPDPPAFTGIDAQDIGDLAHVLGQLIDHRLMKLSFGIDHV